MIVKTLFITGLVCTLGLVACRATRAGYESPDYKVSQSDGNFQVREYGEMVVATATMNGKGKDDGRGFNKLFGYISGKNEADEKIAMTTPVFIDKQKDTMQFILPKKVAEKGAPKAKGTAVTIGTMKGGKFAAVKFKGYKSDVAAEEAAAELVAWAKKNGLTPVGEPVFAFYDPPFTPEALRRNEVLIRLKD